MQTTNSTGTSPQFQGTTGAPPLGAGGILKGAFLKSENDGAPLDSATAAGIMHTRGRLFIGCIIIIS